MKKLVLLVSFAALICGCRDVEERIALKQEGVSIIATIDTVSSTKTTLADDGLKVKWSEEDAIGVFPSSGSGNVKYELSEGAGEVTARFTGSGVSSPYYAYYPYSSSAGSNVSSLSLNLPSEQTQSGSSAEIAAYDLKVGKYSNKTDGGYRFTFTQMLSMFYINFTPSSDLMGDRLEDITLSVEGKSLAGDYTLDVKTPSVTFGSDASSSVKLSFSDKPMLFKSMVEGWMFVNADITSGDAISVVIKTDKHKVTVNVNSSVTVERGYRYTLPLDIASLESAGKATVKTLDPLVEVPAAGNYNSSYVSLFSYEPGTSQSSVRVTSSGYEYRIQNYYARQAMKVVLPSSLVVGNDVTFTISVYGSISGVTAGDVTATVVENDGSRVWLRDASGNGYVYDIN